MSFSVSCGSCGLEYSGRRPFAAAANARDPGFLALLWEIGRWLRTARALARGGDWEQASLARLPRRSRLLAALPPPLPRAAHLGALVDRARPRARVPGRVRDPLLREPRDARLRALPLADGHAAAAARYVDAIAERLGTACTSASACARCGATPTGSSCAPTTTRRTASTRRRRHPRRPGARAARGSDARRAARARRASRTRANEAVLHTDASFLPRAPRRARLVELPARRRRPARR